MKILRVFPRRTKATPTDEDVRIGYPGLFDEADEIRISVTFTWDLPVAERLAKAWESVAPVKIGGPATGMRGEDFEPGMYLKPGYVITSRGCPNRCGFCTVWQREGQAVRELPICDGWNVQDDNLLACSEQHIRALIAMLKRQPERAQFTGGLEAARLKDWHIDLLDSLRPKQMFFAYDSPEDYEPLVDAGRRLLECFTWQSKVLRAFVLIGYPGDSLEAATTRLHDTLGVGMWPMAMLYRGSDGRVPEDPAWRALQRTWARPAAMDALVRAGL